MAGAAATAGATVTGCRVDCHFISSAPPSAPAATNSPICNGFMLLSSLLVLDEAGVLSVSAL
jgi:hypothetical protein